MRYAYVRIQLGLANGSLITSIPINTQPNNGGVDLTTEMGLVLDQNPT
jgi:hypothetical protein